MFQRIFQERVKVNVSLMSCLLHCRCLQIPHDISFIPIDKDQLLLGLPFKYASSEFFFKMA